MLGKGKYIFVTLVLSVLISLQVMPSVVAYTEKEIYDSHFEMGTVNIPYGNGIDDDHDGTIDETDGSEPDVYYGNTNITTGNCTVTDTWNTSYIKKGVTVGGSFEELWSIQCSDNVSIPPTQTCVALEISGSHKGSYQNITNVINVLQFYVTIPASKLMNGASEFWYRSPLAWDSTVYDSLGLYPYHYLNIYDDHGNLVYASRDPANALPSIPNPSVQTDRSRDATYNHRLYYKINMNFRTDVRYCFKEYVKTIGNNPINTVKLWMCNMQDIAADSEMNTYIFVGTTHARMVSAEASWGCIFTMGKGLQGGEKIIFGPQTGESSGYGFTSIYTQWFQGSNLINHTKSIKVIFPLRTSRPLNISVEYRINSGTSRTGWLSDPKAMNITGATGTLIYSFNVTDPNNGSSNWYQMRFVITNLDEDYTDHTGSIHNRSQNAMTFYIYPSNGSGIDTTSLPYSVVLIENYTAICEPNHFFCHIELSSESTNNVAISGSGGPNFWTMLVGIALIVLGIFLIVTFIGAAVGIPIIFGGVSLATATCLAALGVGVTLLGEALVIEGVLGYTLDQAFSHIADATARVFNMIGQGIVRLGLWSLAAIIKTVMDVLAIGNALLYWTTYAVYALMEFMWFALFVLVVLAWSWFLNLMKYIAKGDIEGAWASYKRPQRAIEKRITKFMKTYNAARGEGPSGNIREWGMRRGINLGRRARGAYRNYRGRSRSSGGGGSSGFTGSGQNIHRQPQSSQWRQIE